MRRQWKKSVSGTTDELIFVEPAKTTQHLLLFTNLGNAIYRPVHELADTKWKEIGEHLSQTLTNFEQEEEILFAEIVDQFEGVTYLQQLDKAKSSVLNARN